MQQSSVPGAAAVQDVEEHFAKRRKSALGITIALLVLSVIILVVGLVSATRAENVTIAGYYPGIALSFGAFLGIVGINLVENRKPMLVASIVFVSIGVIVAFFCAIVDGVIAAEFIDRRPLTEGMCQFYASPGKAYDNYQTEETDKHVEGTLDEYSSYFVTCPTYGNRKCKIRVRSNTCYCCDLYNCESLESNVQYYEYTGVNSCMDVIHLYRLLWACVVLNVVALFLGIITAAILGAFKDITPAVQTMQSPAPPPHILYNPTQHVLTYAGFCPSGQALPAYPNYPLPLQHHSNCQPPPPSSDAAMPEESQIPSQASSSYMLTPNAPALYGPAYNPLEKPPPYAS